MVWGFWRASWCGVLLVVAGSGAVGAEGGGLERLLTGGASRAWMVGAEGACGVADSFTFATDHRLVISRCVGRRPVMAWHVWRLGAGDGAGAGRLVISDLGTFEVEEVGGGGLAGGRRLRLREGRASAGIELWSPAD